MTPQRPAVTGEERVELKGVGGEGEGEMKAKHTANTVQTWTFYVGSQQKDGLSKINIGFMACMKAGHRDPELEREIQNWIEEITGEKWPNEDYGVVLRDGQLLCRLMNKLSPGSIKKINGSGAAFKFVENINNVQQAMKNYGVSDLDLFQTPDLFEKKDIPAVTNTICALGRQTFQHPEWKGPWLGKRPGEE